MNHKPEIVQKTPVKHRAGIADKHPPCELAGEAPVAEDAGAGVFEGVKAVVGGDDAEGELGHLFVVVPPEAVDFGVMR
jgi:hypothetical protein